ncbi:MAG: hypothetical protein E6I86_14485 [Chloroflexi bacterium]|nr:MAG: hypothetical protein E6I86_14485 [Chloroflexota bacterium]
MVRPSRLAWGQSLAPVIAVAFLLLVPSCTSVGTPAATSSSSPPSVKDLQALSEDHIFYPGSATIGETTYDASGIDAGGAHPYAGWIMQTTASESEVLAFYGEQLKQQAWQRNNAGVFKGTAEDMVAGWHKGKYIFRLGFWRPGDPRNPGNGAYPTVYGTLLTTENGTD